ncbi:MAG: MbnP family protein [Chitinophagales bacterium]
MNTLKKILFLAIIIVFTFNACKKDAEFNTFLQIEEQVDGASFSMGNAYLNSLNQQYKFETLLFYLSNIALISEDGTEQPLVDVVLHNYTDPNSLKFNIPEGKYTAIKFGLGLDPDLNLTDPTTVAEDSPFHSDRGMYWVWATMYKFVKFEGRASADSNVSDLTDAFLYHLGTNPYYQEITLPRSIEIDDKEETKVKIVLNIDQIFDNATTPIDIINENQTQTGDNPTLAQKVKKNLVAAFE